VESELAIGTKFYIYLPASDKKVAVSKAVDEKLIEGKGRVLRMDDEDMVIEDFNRITLKTK